LFFSFFPFSLLRLLTFTLLTSSNCQIVQTNQKRSIRLENWNNSDSFPLIPLVHLHILSTNNVFRFNSSQGSSQYVILIYLAGFIVVLICLESFLLSSSFLPAHSLLDHRGTFITYPTRPDYRPKQPRYLYLQMCIAAWLTAKYNSKHNNLNSGERARVRYILFASIWTILFGFFYLFMFIFATGSAAVSIASHFVLCVFYVILFNFFV